MNLAVRLDESLEVFRNEAREWLEANFPSSLKAMAPMAGEEAPLPKGGDLGRWRQVVGERGWATPTWPVQYGGAGLSTESAGVLRQEMRRIGAWIPVDVFGVTMIGPTLLEYGNEAQKQQHIPRIARGDVVWCQGYSEPGAGSDLASLRTQATDHGDHFVVTGQKIWTSGAQHADWCFCLVRTDNTKKQEGISFLLIDMTSPGVEVRPIRLISGDSPFCEVFFTDVKVPKENLVGALNGGWTIGKRLLQYERESLADEGEGHQHPLHEVAKQYVGVDSEGRLADQELRVRIAANHMDVRALQLTLLRAAAEAKGAQGPTTTTSVMKNAASRIEQGRAELLIETMGHQGLGWDGPEFAAAELGSVRSWLGGKAMTIYGGSTEVQNNIISKRILGLPESR
ncbi:MAG: acyl-CoA dehydrogenase family protein [Phenylobacterium sp.]|nr:acyl-CoA dehydrogenase family protein [Phenylobacterium sp.]